MIDVHIPCDPFITISICSHFSSKEYSGTGMNWLSLFDGLQQLPAAFGILGKLNVYPLLHIYPITSALHVSVECSNMVRIDRLWSRGAHVLSVKHRMAKRSKASFDGVEGSIYFLSRI